MVIPRSYCDKTQPKSMERTLAIKVVIMTETKNLKILITDNFFSCHLIVMQLCTIIELGNTQYDHHFHGNHLIKWTKKCLMASFLELLRLLFMFAAEHALSNYQCVLFLNYRVYPT